MMRGLLRVAAFEWRLLRAERALVPLVALLLGAAAYAGRNGRVWTDFARSTAQEARVEERERLRRLEQTLDSLASDTSAATPFGDPRYPYTAGQTSARRYASLPPSALAALAVGQSDLFPSYYRTSMLSRESFLSNDEVENPVNLAVGRFDLAFVVVYVLPLLIIALTFDVVSADREGGRLALLAAQPVGIREIIAGKVIARGAVIIALALLVTLAGTAAAGIDLAQGDAARLLASWSVVTIAYALFWLAAAVLVNLFGRSSAANALALLGLWLVTVVLVPSGLAAVVAEVHPTPSRVELMTATRVASNIASARGSQLLALYYQDHPELMRGQRVNANEFGTRTIVVAQDVARATRPLAARFDDALASQQALVNRWRFASPAVATYDALVTVAGTDAERYRDFQRQVDAYIGSVERYFVPMMAMGSKVTAADVRAMPSFEYRDAPAARAHARAATDMAAVLIAAAVILVAGTLRRRAVAVLSTDGAQSS
jgi:ABC-2 type transport system permease protein